jgi:hypothetical protein
MFGFLDNLPIPQLPRMPQMPGLPGLPGFPGLPGLPQLPRMPQLPQLPQIPNPLAPVFQAGRDFMGGINNTPQTGDAVTRESADGHAAADQPTSFFGRLGQGIGDVGRGLSQEGLGGILDPFGMMDRQQAQRDLSGRFQVLPDDFVGPRRANQVSQDEYQNIARTFSSVRRGTGDLSINTSGFDGANAETESAEYRQGSLDRIADMMMTTGGRRQINNLNNNVAMNDDGTQRTDANGDAIHRHTTIEPLWGVNGGVDANGRTIWNDPGAGNHTNATMRSDNATATPLAAGSRRNADGTRGTGTDVRINWNPGAENIGNTGVNSDIILAHEMEHAVNQSQGTNGFNHFGGTNPDGTPITNTGEARIRNSERQAVGLSRTDGGPGGGHYPGDPDGCTENTYRQERNDLGLGEMWLPRERYTHLPGQAGSQADLDAAWARHNASGNARPRTP